MTCTGNVDSYGIEQRSASGAFEEWGPTGLSGSWQRGPFSAGTTKMYCTYYYVGEDKSHAGDCITVTWSAGAVFVTLNAPSSAFGNSYTVSWSSQNATSCILKVNGVTVSTDLSGSINHAINNSCNNASQCVPKTHCTTRQDTTYNDNWELTCSNSADSKSVSQTTVVSPRVCW
jgi:hypothetical protein